MDGRSLMPLISNPNQEEWRDKFLVEHWSKEGQLPRSYKMIRTDFDALILYQDAQGREFYNLEKDPYQLENKINCTSAACKEKINELQKWVFELRLFWIVLL